MKRKLATYLFLLAVLITAPLQTTLAQVMPGDLSFPHNHLPWFTIESEHFLVHYQQGNSQSAAITSVIAEEIYEPVTSLYGHQPRKKVSIVLRDREDYSNGAAFFFDDKIEIWLPSLDTPLRGTTHWLRNVITHEFTHIVQLGASMKRSQRFPAIYFQWLNYEDVRRPDVLYGFPNGVITKPFATVSIPAWFAEGTAQYQAEGSQYDSWDTHRDMLLRAAILNESWLSFDEMGTFTSKNSLEREMIYNQGYGFTLFLVERFGEEVVAKISAEAANSRGRNFSRVIKRATGVDGDELFEEWINIKKASYSDLRNTLEPFETESLYSEGFFNFYPQYSPNGSHFAWLSNRGRDYARTSLLVVDGDELVEVDEIFAPDLMDSEQQYQAEHGTGAGLSLDFVSNRFSFSPDGKMIAYSRPKQNRFGEIYTDLFIYDLDERERKRVTRSERVQDPAWHPEKSLVVAVRQRAGTQNLVLIDTELGEIRQLTRYSGGETVYTPVWHPDGDQIIYATATTGSRNINRHYSDRRESFPVFADDETDYRDPWVDPAGEYIYFSSDETGIFNIYRKRIGTNRVERLTETIGGAFMPFVEGNQLYFSEYGAGGYWISRTSAENQFTTSLEPHPGYLTGEEPVHPDSQIRIVSYPGNQGTPEAADITIRTSVGSEARSWQP
ncbi:MAG: PD40 domain-containing protein [Balneolaceae bacterium]|nr:PD40 domain-containing protein [Balneolaceae bacterium]